MNDKQGIRFLRLLKDMYDKQEFMSQYFTEKASMAFELDELVEIYLDLLGVPVDTSVESDADSDDYYCRDYHFMCLFDYVLGHNDSSAEDTYEKLKEEL